ncbi:hypothetical protein [Phormidesmis priestleyi]
MKKFEYPVGSIVQLVGVRHCGVVVDDCKSVELIARKDEIQQKMICKLVLVDLATTSLHPVNNKPPEYNLRQTPNFPWETSQIKSRIGTLKPKYHDSEYHVIYNNCQHFAWELSTGKAESPDAKNLSPIGGLIGWAFHIKEFGSTSSTSAGSMERLSQSLDSFLLI